MKKPEKRDTVTYQLKQGRKVVYIGETNDIEATEQRHKDDGKNFTKILTTSVKITKTSAEQREADKLETYRRSHKGKNPKYNKTDNG
ncbi:hypothetical protein HOG47_06950 [archaeon]|jgi:predicted GIY-YIG superfamily endonuclease|nr:hypothetical protein [archaeon]